MSETTRTSPARTIADLMPPVLLDRVQKRALLIFAVAALASILGAATPSYQHHFLRAYLVGYILGLGLSLGSLGLLMVQYLTKGNWGFLIRRQLEAGSRLFPLMFVLFAPIAVAVWGHRFYPWADKSKLSADDLAQFKMHAYLTPQWFIVRAVIYFVVWIGVSYLLNKWGKEQDHKDVPDLPRSRRFQTLAGPGLVLFCITVTLAVVDWIMSLDMHWYSTMYGLVFIDGQALAIMCFIIMMTAALFKYRPMAQVLVPQTLHDLGNLTLAMVMLFAYFSFSQFLIIWSGNLPEEIHWYMNRINTGWGVVAMAIVLFHFAIPFFFLLHKPIKRNIKFLVPIALILFLARYIDLLWYVVPNFPSSDPRGLFSWLDLTCPIAIVSLWIAAFCWQLKSRPLFPVYDPLWTEVDKLHGH